MIDRPPAQPPRGSVLLVLLSRLPKAAVLIALLALVVGGLLLPGVAGAVLLGVVGALLAWLLSVAWPVLVPGQRIPRLLTVALVLGYAVWKATR